MNYLAHFYLSFDNSDLLIGQFLGDYVKGSRYGAFSNEIQQGILLHRFIDSTTDTSILTEGIRNTLRSDLGRYTGIALDVYFDHFLAIHWNTYHNTPLQEFIQWVYSQLTDQIPTIDGGARNKEMHKILNYMTAYNWLGRYSEISGIERTLIEMSKRLPVGNTLFNAPSTFKKTYVEIESAFFKFFPQPILDSKHKLDTFANCQA